PHPGLRRDHLAREGAPARAPPREAEAPRGEEAPRQEAGEEAPREEAEPALTLRGSSLSRPEPAESLARSGASPDNRGMPLTLGPLTVPVPVVLAPMAGITNAAYRRLCAEQGAGLYVCEMITSRGLVERDTTTLKMLVFDELETTRSVQLYGTDPAYVGKAT